ncbi:MAG: HD domain-containing protein [Candidatus Sungbacteria bacterium]|nr:HD domain-containing protein [Candidatus Sungbacteria bacterium]
MATKNSMNLLRLMELTRAQALQGYILSEVPKTELPDLAQHHYLVTFIAWRLASYAKKRGAKISVEKVLEYALVHDLGELFGGDISMPYAKANPAAKEAARAFEMENQRFFSKFFDDDKEYIQELFAQVMDAKSDEVLIAKIADYIEITQFKLYVKKLTKGDITMAGNKIQEKINKISDTKAKVALKNFTKDWVKQMKDGTLKEIFEADKWK